MAAGLRRRLWVVLALAAVAIAAGAVVLWPRSEHDRPVAAPPPATSAAARPPSPIHVVPLPSVPHDLVVAARPTAFTFSGPAFTIKATVCSMAGVSPLDPPGEQHHTVCWVNSRWGVEPGSRSGTSLILGHAWGQDRFEVLNKLSARATGQILTAKPRTVGGVRIYPVTDLDGYTVTLATKYGTLEYRVRSAYGVAKSDLPHLSAPWNGHIPNRVVLVTCAERNGVDYDYNVVVDAYLVSSKSAAAA